MQTIQCLAARSNEQRGGKGEMREEEREACRKPRRETGRVKAKILL